MPARPNISAISSNASRLRFRISRLIGEQITRVNTTDSLLDASRNGKFNFGAFQMNTLVTRLPTARMGGPSTSSFSVGP